MTNSQAEHARLLRSLHDPAAPLALANAWDVASARVIEAAGASAIATTSAGVAWSLGAPDGDVLSRERALDLVGRIVAAVGVPVTADIEGGYGQDADGVAETIAGVIAAGAAGVNIEDGARPPGELVARIGAARAAVERTEGELFVNARIDTYLFGLGEESTRLKDTLDRAQQYVDAGADGIFVPGVADIATITALVEGISVPLNIMAGPGSPSVAELGTLGVARVSLGSGVAQAAYAAAQRAARDLFGDGTYDSLADAIAFPEINSLLAGPR
ncbi:isocitrate lyase/PEP mutase family protein [Streptomyces beijiangensis]|uniref:Isocitrate lyase/phosphoenolpyruvate mutase family protein n=1 Tax=Streptomyces beijiangensis TaxID=163361 RepID=A0A939JKG9_9ACTN|nr:isocitrate lyase/phosphoenolpyruvate mutase family protein [Streptomyces beijiangensis]MBO0515285.1 isocitrate lyase/phosphoenolpyruvate mutase family protein [Streptomyces beijiangensis]